MLALSAPAVALLIAGIVVLVAFPVYSAPQSCACAGPPGSICNCPSLAGTFGPNPIGILLLAAAGTYGAIASVLVLVMGRRPRRSAPGPATL